MPAKIIPFPASRIVRQPQKKGMSVEESTAFWNNLSNGGMKRAADAMETILKKVEKRGLATCAFCDNTGVYEDIISPITGATDEFYCTCDIGKNLKKAQNP